MGIEEAKIQDIFTNILYNYILKQWTEKEIWSTKICLGLKNLKNTATASHANVSGSAGFTGWWNGTSNGKIGVQANCEYVIRISPWANHLRPWELYHLWFFLLCRRGYNPHLVQSDLVCKHGIVNGYVDNTSKTREHKTKHMMCHAWKIMNKCLVYNGKSY